MASGGIENKLKVVMPGITKTEVKTASKMAQVTIRNGSGIILRIRPGALPSQKEAHAP
jgi:hypothetical protein